MIEDQHEKGRKDGTYLLAQLSEIEKELPFHLVGAGCDFYQYPIDRPFGYNAFQWLQTISGTGILEINGETVPIEEGHGALLYPGAPHAYYAAEDPWHIHWITVNGYHVENMLHYIGLKKSGVYGISEPPMMASHIRKALQILSNPSEMTGLDGSVCAYQLLINLYKYVVNDYTDHTDYNIKRLTGVFDMIEEKIGEPLTIEDLAAEAAVTPQYFCEIFKEATHQRPIEYLNQRRISRAKELILNKPSMKIQDIASAVGFESSGYFATVFKKQEGLSPHRFRELNLR